MWLNLLITFLVLRIRLLDCASVSSNKETAERKTTSATAYHGGMYLIPDITKTDESGDRAARRQYYQQIMKTQGGLNEADEVSSHKHKSAQILNEIEEDFVHKYKRVSDLKEQNDQHQLYHHHQQEQERQSRNQQRPLSNKIQAQHKYLPDYDPNVKPSASTPFYTEDLSDFQSFMMHQHERKHASLHKSFFDEDARKGNYGDRQMRAYGKSDLIPTSTPLRLENDTVSYTFLRQSPHGRHLLLITLLEGFDVPYWKPRCDSYVKMYLPDSLKETDQPEPQPDACILKDVVLKGKKLTRSNILKIFEKSLASRVKRSEKFSRFQQNDVHAVNAVVKLALQFEDFDSLLSMLLVIKDSCNRRVFIEALFVIIQAREDVGYILPSFHSITPSDFFPIQEKISTEDLDHRSKNESEVDYLDGGRRSDRQLRTSFFSFRTTHRTYPVGVPEYNLWHLREDAMVNSMHSAWHIILSNANSGPLMARRGEMFIYMHKQLLNRYNLDRLAAGMPFAEPYNEAAWGTNSLIGYNSNIGRITGGRGDNYPARPNFRRLSNEAIRSLGADANRLIMDIDAGVLNNNMRSRLVYDPLTGQDLGISPLGDVLESYGGDQSYGNLHNIGHVHISNLGRDAQGNGGVMGFTQTAVRDPAFFRWHSYIDSFPARYKRNLGPYTESEIIFPEVGVADFFVESMDRRNILRTFIEATTVNLDTNLISSQFGTSYTYDRVNHEPFSYVISLNSTVVGGAIGRIFLVPRDYTDLEGTVDQAWIEMDKFYIELSGGSTQIVRRSIDSPFFSDGPLALRDLQTNLLRGINEDDFNWAHCGWPRELSLPRGRVGGMEFNLIFMASSLLPGDRVGMAEWNRLSRTSWGWCGLRRGEGTIPDSRPMGYPFDRPFPLDSIVGGKPNVMITPITIEHMQTP